MSHRLDTPSPQAGQLSAGEFDMGPSYATWRARGTDDWLLILTLGGAGRFGHSSGMHVATAGNLVALRPHTPHDYRTAPEARRWRLRWVHFIPRADWLEWLEWPEIGPGHLLLDLRGTEHRQHIERRFGDLVRLGASAHRRREALAANALEEVLHWCDSINPRSAQGAVDDRIRRALDHICAHLAEPLSIPHLAAHVSLSPSRFSHLFRAEVGETPQRYLELQRMQQARKMLAFTQEPIAAVARLSGFDNPFYFALRFRRHTGKSPREWRRQRPEAAQR